jgi:hypothetical protein
VKKLFSLRLFRQVVLVTLTLPIDAIPLAVSAIIFAITASSASAIGLARIFNNAICASSVQLNPDDFAL